MKKLNLKKLSLNQKVIPDLQQKKIKGGTIVGCPSFLDTCGPPESIEPYPALPFWLKKQRSEKDH